MPPSLKLPIFLISVALSLCFVKGVSAAANVYYSVGQSTADLQTSTSTVSVSSGVATFSVAQTGNIGVGDRVSIKNGNGTTTVYISGKTSGTVWSVVTATGTAPADISATTTLAINREFTSLNAAISAASNSSHMDTTDLATSTGFILNLPCYYDSGPDTTAVSINGYTTAADNFINIYTPTSTTEEVNSNQRHQGKWDDGKYRLEFSSSVNGATILNYENHVRIDGLQVSAQPTSINYRDVICSGLSSNNGFYVSNNIIKGVNNFYGSGIYSNRTLSAWNNIIYDMQGPTGYGMYHASTYYWYVYNNTIVNCGYGIHNSGSNFHAKNNIIYNNADNYYGSFDASSTNNLSGPTQTDAPGSNPQNAKAVTFADFANNDFHLSPSDTSAKNAGADLSADANLAIVDDIDGQTRRTNSWSIGADEGANAVYYSVGQNTTDHKTGSPTVTVTSGTATFSIAQTATNMGVGDKITYGSPVQTAFISKKIDTSSWSLITATGTVPANITATSVVSIAHAFSSINTAMSSATGASYLNTSDLKTNNLQLNFPCYYDSGAGTNGMTIYGYTTSPSNYMRVYTPFSTVSEVNLSQRHNGKWSTGKYRLETSNGSSASTIGVEINNLWIDGLQLKGTASDGGTPRIINIASDSSDMEVKISNNIIWGVFSGMTTYGGTGIGDDGWAESMATKYIWNNIIYDSSLSTHFKGIVTYGGNAYVYNNTIYNADISIDRNGGTIIAKNNIVQNSNNGYRGTFSSASDYNISDIDGDAKNATFATTSKTVLFVDAADYDYHLADTDVSAKGYGANLSQDPYFAFSTDIDGGQRTGNWDIGADQFMDGHINPTNDDATQNSNLLDGLVLKHTFDGHDIVSTTSIDRSGYGHDGNIIGATPVTGKIGQAMSFDGNNDSVYIGDENIIDNATEASVCSWLYYQPSSVTSDNAIISKYISGNPGWIFWVDDVTGYSGRIDTIAFAVNGVGGIGARVEGSSGLVISNQWDFYCGVFKGGQHIRLYKNGVLDQENTSSIVSNVASSSYPIELGVTNTNWRLDGQLDELRVYNRALSGDEVKQLYNLSRKTTINSTTAGKNASGLVGHWTFDGQHMDWASTTAEARDQSGNGSHGNVIGASAVIGKLGQGMKFDGIDDWVSIADKQIFDFEYDDSFAISAWVRMDTTDTSSQLLLAKAVDISPYTGWHIQINQSCEGNDYGKISFALTNAPMTKEICVRSSSDVSYIDGKWHLYSITYNGSGVAAGVTIYEDGIQLNLTVVRNNLNSNTILNNIPINIGSRGDEASASFNGRIDDVRIYNRALSADEIAGLYNLGKVKLKR